MARAPSLPSATVVRGLSFRPGYTPPEWNHLHARDMPSGAGAAKSLRREPQPRPRGAQVRYGLRLGRGDARGTVRCPLVLCYLLAEMPFDRRA